MDILVTVVNQKLRIATNLQNLVSGSQEFIRFVFDLSEDWDGLNPFAQFHQDGIAYNRSLDENNSVYLPNEIAAGTCKLTLYGSSNGRTGTTNYVTLYIDENIFVYDAITGDGVPAAINDRFLQIEESIRSLSESISGKYTLPANGIPYNDLSSAVQQMILNSGGDGSGEPIIIQGDASTTYGFATQAALTSFINDYPNAFKQGDYVWVKDGDYASHTYTLNIVNQSNQLREVFKIGDTLVVTVSSGNNNQLSANKTIAQINTELNSGKNIALRTEYGVVLNPTYYTANGIYFTTVADFDGEFYARTYSITGNGLSVSTKSLSEGTGFKVVKVIGDDVTGYVVDIEHSDITSPTQINAILNNDHSEDVRMEIGGWTLPCVSAAIDNAQFSGLVFGSDSGILAFAYWNYNNTVTLTKIRTEDLALKSDIISGGGSGGSSGSGSDVTEATVAAWGFTKNTGTYTMPVGGIPKEDLSDEVQGMLEVAGELVDVSEAVEAAETAAAAAEAAAEAAQGGAGVVVVTNLVTNGDLATESSSGFVKQGSAGTLSYDAEMGALKLEGGVTVRTNGLKNGAMVQGHHYYAAADFYIVTDGTADGTAKFRGNRGSYAEVIPCEQWVHVVAANAYTGGSSVNVNDFQIYGDSGVTTYVKNITLFDLDLIIPGQTFSSIDLKRILNGEYQSPLTIVFDDALGVISARIPYDIEIDRLLPTKEFYTFARAIAGVPLPWRRLNQIVSFAASETRRVRIRYDGTDVSGWSNLANWTDLTEYPAAYGVTKFTTTPLISDLGEINFTEGDFFLELVMGKRDNSSSSSINLVLFSSDTSVLKPGIRTRAGMFEMFGSTASGTTYIFQKSNSTLVDGYNDVIITRKNGITSVYINGTLVKSAEQSGDLFDITGVRFTSSAPALALVRFGTNADTVPEDRYNGCSPLSYDASNDGVTMEMRNEDFHDVNVYDRVNKVFYPCAATINAIDPFPAVITSAGTPAVVPQFIGQLCYDTANHIEYHANGRSGVGNWARYATATEVATKQDALVSGITIKTVGGVSLLGAGNIPVGEGEGGTGGSGVVINVKDYGAVGNGATDDTAAIHRALETVRAVKGTLFFPYGTYLTRKGLVLEACMSVDADRGAILKNASAVLDDDNGNHGTGSCAVTTLTAGISAGAHTCTVASTVGLAVGQCITIFTSGVSSYTDTHADITEINGNEITFSTSRFTRDGTDGGAIYAHTSGSYVTTDFALIETVYRDSQHITIKNITLQQCGNTNEPYIYTISAIHQTKQGATGSVQKDFRVINVTVDGGVHDGISLQGSSDAWVEGCIVQNVREKAFHFGTSCERVTIRNNLAVGCGASNSDSLAGANGGGGAVYWCVNNHNVIVDGNQFINCRRGCFGFDYRGNGEQDTDSIITNNLFQNCAVAGVQTVGGYRLLVSGNIFRGFTGTSVPILMNNASPKLTHASIVNNIIGDFANGYTNTNGAIKMTGAVSPLVSGNSIQKNTSASGSVKIVLASCSNAQVINNIAEVDATDSGNVDCIIAYNGDQPSGGGSSGSVTWQDVLPSNGIPQSDLDATLSGKIDGALQTSGLTAKTSAMTQAVGYDSTTGQFFTAPGSGGSSVVPTPTSQQAGYVPVAGNDGTVTWTSVTSWAGGGNY